MSHGAEVGLRTPERRSDPPPSGMSIRMRHMLDGTDHTIRLG